MSNVPEIIEAVEARSRAPFAAHLAILLGVQPPEDRLKEWSHDHPDKWGTLIAQMAKLAGYKDGVEVDFSANVNHLSDAEIEAEIQRRMAEQPVMLEG